MNAFIKDILLQAGNLRTDNVMFTFGSDFQYENAIEYYKNLDKLMKYTMQKVIGEFENYAHWIMCVQKLVILTFHHVHACIV